MKKLFISHATEDQEGFVRPLAEALRADFDVWYSEYSLVIGMELFKEISKGLASCDHGVVVLSEHFFAKAWPQRELDGLFTLEEEPRRIILPVWHGVSKEQVCHYSPILAGRLAANSEDGIDAVVDEIKRSVAYFERGQRLHSPPSGLSRLGSAIQRKTEQESSDRIVRSDRGVSVVGAAGQQALELLAEQAQELQKQIPSGINVKGPDGNNVRCYTNVRVGAVCLRGEYVNDVKNSAYFARLRMMILESGDSPWGPSELPEPTEIAEYAPFIAQDETVFWREEGEPQTLSAEDIINIWFGKLSEAVVVDTEP